MKMSGEERIEAPREAVYAALNDPEILRRSIPGCKELNKLSDTEMVARVGLAVGPVRATFSGAVSLQDLDPPNGYRIVGEGKGGAAGFAKGGASVRLEEDGAATILHYDVDADVGGKLAQLGSRLIDSTSRKLAKQFFETFGEIVGNANSPRSPEPATDAPEPRPAVTPEPAMPPAPEAVCAASRAANQAAGTAWYSGRTGLIIIAGAVLLALVLLATGGS